MEDTGMTTQTETSTIEHGCVKWFNNRAGYGFITVTEGEHKDEDIFIHHTQIDVSEEQYKYLVQGEYVEFDLSKSDNSEHEWQAVNVKGVQGGLLMCETRYLNRQEREQHSTNDDDGGDNRRRGNRRGHRNPRQRGGGPRDNPRRNAQRWVLDENNSRSQSATDGHE